MQMRNNEAGEQYEAEVDGGVALAAMVLGVLIFISLITGAPYFGYTVDHFLWIGFGSAAAIGALAGFLGGTFFGSALGALFGGVRALARH